jgi:hypothetical protein
LLAIIALAAPRDAASETTQNASAQGSIRRMSMSTPMKPEPTSLRGQPDLLFPGTTHRLFNPLIGRHALFPDRCFAVRAVFTVEKKTAALGNLIVLR